MTTSVTRFWNKRDQIISKRCPKIQSQQFVITKRHFKNSPKSLKNILVTFVNGEEL